MSSQARFSWCVLFVVVAVALNALPAAALAASSTVTIAVPSIQQVEGTTSLVVPANALLQPGQLLVKSNTPWVLVAHASGAVAGVTWRIAGGTTWQQVGAATPVLRGLKGVHQVKYEVQLDARAARDGQPATVTFTVEQADAH